MAAFAPDDTARWIETEFEMNEQVFVPAGDGAPPQWMPKGDLLLGEFKRYVQGQKDAAELERTERYCALLDEARRRAGGNAGATLGSLLSREEIAELNMLEMTLGATWREQDRRQAAIDRNIAARRYWVLRAPPPGTKA